MKVLNELFKLQDLKYAEIVKKFSPTIDSNKVIGVRVPQIRVLAKKLVLEKETQEFLNKLPHEYFDENMLHSAIISEIVDYEQCIEELNKFLPYVDSWSVCDTIIPKTFKKNQEKLIKEIKKWLNSKKTYTIRFGIKMLMTYYLDNNFKLEYLKIVSRIKTDEYYVKMMISWYYATALTKRWNETIKYLEENKLEIWIHNKVIQKSIESYRITKEQKEYLKSLRK